MDFETGSRRGVAVIIAAGPGGIKEGGGAGSTVAIAKQAYPCQWVATQTVLQGFPQAPLQSGQYPMQVNAVMLLHDAGSTYSIRNCWRQREVDSEGNHEGLMTLPLRNG